MQKTRLQTKTYHNERLFVVAQILFQPQHGVQVQMVGRFVQKHDLEKGALVFVWLINNRAHTSGSINSARASDTRMRQPPLSSFVGCSWKDRN
jgi:hypothetical protein